MSEYPVNRMVPQVVEAVPGRSPLAVPPEKPAPARIWLTAEMLIERARGGSTATIAANEFLTPAARDYAVQHELEIRRGETAVTYQRVVVGAAPTGGAVHPAALTHTLGLVVARQDGKVSAALAGLVRAGVQTVGFAETKCPLCNTRAMCEAINAGRLAGGVVIDRYAAAAVVYAAKIRGIRPVQGVSPAAVDAGLRQFDANVLVIGYEPVSIFEFRTMLARFAAGRGPARQRTPLLEEIEKLETKV